MECIMATLTSPIAMDSTEVFATFRKFVVAYDFSSSAETALEYAIDLAAKQNAEVILVHAQDRQAIAVGADGEETAKNIPLDLGERLEWIAESSRKQGIDARYLVKAGSPAEALSQVVTDLQPNILFLGAFGITGWIERCSVQRQSRFSGRFRAPWSP
jgi:nucleotide-binding universal stress UspA family protein